MTAEPMSRLVDSLRTALDADGETDAALLNRVRANRDPAAVEAIVRRHGPKVLAAGRKVLGHSSDVDDAFQATFLVLLRNPAAIRKHASLGSWLYGVAHRIALQAYKHRKRRKKSVTEVAHEGPDLSWREACAILHEELNRLPDAMRVPLLLCYLDGLSRDEAAAQLGRTLNSVKKSLEKGREVLRKRLTKRGIALSAGLLAAVGEPLSADVSPKLTQLTVQGVVRPSDAIATLAHTANAKPIFRTLVIGAVASAFVVGMVLGFPRTQTPEPPTKTVPDEPVAKKDDTEDHPKGERIAFAGKVVDPDGKPVKGAKVYLLRWGELPASPGQATPPRLVDTTVKATTDDDGRYRFEVAKTDYPEQWWQSKPQIVISADRFGLGIHSVRVHGHSEANVTLAGDVPIRGRVINLEGKPVVNAKVQVIEITTGPTDDLSEFVKKADAEGIDRNKNWTDDFFPKRIGRLKTELPCVPPVTTDKDGRFELKGVGRERLAKLLIEGETVATARVTVLTQEGVSGLFPIVNPLPTKPGQQDQYYRSPFDYVVDPGQTLEGIVTDKSTGKPIPGVIVSIASLATTTTDKNGKYRIVGARPFRYAMSFRAPPDVPYMSRGMIGGRQGAVGSTRVDVALLPALWVDGRVIDARSKDPIAGAMVEYRAAANNASAPHEPDPALNVDVVARTGKDGKFRLPGLAGKGWLVIRHEQAFMSAADRELQGAMEQKEPPMLITAASTHIYPRALNAVAAVDVDPTKSQEQIVSLDPGVKITVTLVDRNDKPINGAVVFGTRRYEQNWSQPVTSEKVEFGTFNPNRPRRFVFYHKDRSLGAVFRPKNGETGPWTVKLQPTATVTGRLVLPDNKPLVNASLGVSLKLGEVETGPHPEGFQVRFKTDTDGRFEFPRIVGDVDYVFWGVTFDTTPESHRYTFSAKPAEIKDLGTIKTREPNK